MNTFNQDTLKDKRRSWTPRIITLAITFLAILYFYPRNDTESLYRYKDGQLWDHGDLVTQDSLVVPPDSASFRLIEDSIKNSFVYIYTPVPAPDINVKSIVDSVDTYLKTALHSSTGLLDNLLPDDWNILGSGRLASVRRNVRNNIERAYRGKVVAVENGATTPRKVIMTEESRAFSDDINSTDDIVNTIMSSVEMEDFPVDSVSPDVIKRFLIPNIALNKEMSEARFEAELGLEIDNRTLVFAPGYRIIKRGDMVTPQQGRLISMYTKQQLSKDNFDRRSTWLLILGQAIYILMLLGALVGYMRFYAPKVWGENRNFIFIISLVGLFVIAGALLSKYLVLGLYLVPIVMVPILVQVFFHGRMAMWTGITVVLLSAGMAANGLMFAAVEFVGVAVAVYSLRDLTKRSQLLQTSFLVGLSYIFMYIAFELMSTGTFDSILGRMITVLAVNAVLASMCYVLMFAFERLFGFISNVTLVELTDVNTPLLRALSDQCPGTFNHVMAVSNLADDAARQIGANALLTRAGAMYHDIGKLANPTFFTENQHGINPHDGLSPLKSAEIIINHVNEGLKRAEKAGLPPMIRDFISEHHGAGQAKYFYYTY